MGLVISFSGQIGSGKSSISSAIATTLGWKRVSFGDYLRAEVKKRGGNPDFRHTLQELGQTLVETNPESFCRSVLELADFLPGGDLIVDGVRHVKIQKIIGKIVAPSNTKLIHFSAHASTRVVRVADRPVCKFDFARADRHPVEEESRYSLPVFADAVVDTQTNLDSVFHECLELVQTWSGL